jgi:hypothetical protein
MSFPAAIENEKQVNDPLLEDTAEDTVEVTFHDRYHYNLQKTIKKTFKYSDTWLTVAEMFIRARPYTSKTTWFMWRGLLGTDVPLTTTLADTLEVWKKDEEENKKENRVELKYCFEITATSMLNLTVLYEHINYAVAFARAKLTWPLWQKDDTDVFNHQFLGAFDALRARRGSLQVPKNEDNGIDHLVGIRGPGGLVRVTNVYQLHQFLIMAQKKGDGIRDPFFFQDVPYENLGDLLELCNTRIADKVLLPIYEMGMKEPEYFYHLAFEKYSEELKTYKPGQEELDDMRKHGENMKIANCSYPAYQAIHDGKSLNSAIMHLAPLSPEAQQTTAEKITAYAKGLKDDSRSLVEMYIASMIEFPHCVSDVFRRRGDILVKLYPERYSSEEHERLKRIHAAATIFKEMAINRLLIERCMGLDVENIKRINEEKLQLLLSQNDWTKETPSIIQLSKDAKLVAAQYKAIDAARVSKYKKDQFDCLIPFTEEENAKNHDEARRIFKEMEEELDLQA